jgi:hypothetical protein
LKRFVMHNFKKLVSTAFVVHFRLSTGLSPQSEEEEQFMLRVLYSSVVGSIMYAIVCSRLDISQAISVVSRYITNPEKVHWQKMKWILQCLRCTIDVGLVYNMVSIPFSLDMLIQIMLVIWIRIDFS